MTDQELLAKLDQIEEHARLTLSEYPSRDLIRERQRMIIALTKFMRSGLAARGIGLPPPEQTLPPSGPAKRTGFSS
ncbi:MAG: hypothetical protein ACT4P4_07505 [Betaproteobacteria bacterium]